MPENRKYLDFVGLTTYDEKIKEYINREIGKVDVDVITRDDILGIIGVETLAFKFHEVFDPETEESLGEEPMSTLRISSALKEGDTLYPIIYLDRQVGSVKDCIKVETVWGEPGEDPIWEAHVYDVETEETSGEDLGVTITGNIYHENNVFNITVTINGVSVTSTNSDFNIDYVK